MIYGLLLSFGSYLLWCFLQFRIAKKADLKSPWVAFIPVINVFQFIQLAKLSYWWFLALMIPVLNIGISLWMCMRIASRFGEKKGFGILLLFPPVSFWAQWKLGNKNTALNTDDTESVEQIRKALHNNFPEDSLKNEIIKTGIPTEKADWLIAQAKNAGNTQTKTWVIVVLGILAIPLFFAEIALIFFLMLSSSFFTIFGGVLMNMNMKPESKNYEINISNAVETTDDNKESLTQENTTSGPLSDKGLVATEFKIIEHKDEDEKYDSTEFQFTTSSDYNGLAIMTIYDKSNQEIDKTKLTSSSRIFASETNKEDTHILELSGPYDKYTGQKFKFKPTDKYYSELLIFNCETLDEAFPEKDCGTEIYMDSASGKKLINETEYDYKEIQKIGTISPEEELLSENIENPNNIEVAAADETRLPEDIDIPLPVEVETEVITDEKPKPRRRPPQRPKIETEDNSENIATSTDNQKTNLPKNNIEEYIQAKYPNDLRKQKILSNFSIELKKILTTEDFKEIDSDSFSKATDCLSFNRLGLETGMIENLVFDTEEKMDKYYEFNSYHAGKTFEFNDENLICDF